MFRELNWLNAITLYAIHGKAIFDLLFRSAPLLSNLRGNGFLPYEGGVEMNYLYTRGTTRGGAYLPGQAGSTEIVHPWDAFQFNNRYQRENINEHLETLLINSGPYATFNNLEILHQLAVTTMNARLNTALYRHGQVTSGGVDRTAETCGLEEICNDGVTPSWFGNTFGTYGNVNRLASSGAAPGLRSVPYFAGNPSTGARAPLAYKHFLAAWQQACHGAMKPDLILGNKGAMRAILTSMWEKQRITDGVSPHYGVQAWKFMGATILEDEYAPSAADAFGVDAQTANEIGSNVTPSTITYNSTLVDPRSNLGNRGGGTSVTFEPGEVIAFLNVKDSLMWRNAVQPAFSFGFTGYERLPTTNQIHGRIQNMGTLHSPMPWCNVFLMGILPEGI